MYNLITILGPTASGKTTLAALLAQKLDGEIISADSRQVYRGMDIGTGKDIGDYYVSGQLIPYHLIDIVDPGYEFNVFEFKQHFYTAWVDITNRKKMPVLCGGTGMYIDALVRDYEMDKVPVNNLLREQLAVLTDSGIIERLKQYRELHNTTDTENRERTIRAIEIEVFKKEKENPAQEKPKLSPLIIGVHFERSVIRERITLRLKQRLENGMVEEVERLLSEGLKPEQLSFYGLEYRYLTQYVTGELSREEMIQKLNTAIHQFSKRQMTWFRRMQKKGVEIHWVDGNSDDNEKVKKIIQLLNS